MIDTDTVLLWLPGAGGTTSQAALQLHEHIRAVYKLRVVRLEDHHGGRVPWKKGKVEGVDNSKLITDCVSRLISESNSSDQPNARINVKHAKHKENLDSRIQDTGSQRIVLCGASFGGRVALEIIAQTKGVAQTLADSQKLSTRVKTKSKDNKRSRKKVENDTDTKGNGWDEDMCRSAKQLQNAAILCGYPLYPPGNSVPERHTKRDRVRHIQAIQTPDTRLLFITGDADEFVTRDYLNKDASGPDSLERIVRETSKAECTFHVIPTGKHSIPDCGGGRLGRANAIESVAELIANFVGAGSREGNNSNNNNEKEANTTRVTDEWNRTTLIDDHRKGAKSSQNVTVQESRRKVTQVDSKCLEQRNDQSKRKLENGESSRKSKVSTKKPKTAKWGKEVRKQLGYEGPEREVVAEVVNRSGRPVRQCRR